ncbi:acetate--CoA ligase family protein [candidate division CSSED10-310 bacterium]|uniref:Acetate--CoA ligase family protein n=1 Tax=candidate division CSSED10-310 bacterium TaxID=2855610 RepID=A0ABV6Z4P7_UNCC1
MNKFFYPNSVAIVGVSDSATNLARIIFFNLIKLGFSGKIFGIGQMTAQKFKHILFPSISVLPQAVDLAVILTPAKTVPDILAECGQRNIQRVIIESGGFSEYDERGTGTSEILADIAGRYSIRFVGPNCIGTKNNRNGLYLTFAPVHTMGPVGSISLISQSGGMASYYYMHLQEQGLNMSKGVSIGNKLDLDECDFLEYFIADPETETIGLYLEGIERGRTLCQLAANTHKPVIVQKSNRKPGSSAIACSHTAALASDDTIVDAALKQAGIIRVRTSNEFLNVLKIFELPRMKGNRVAILSRSGGHAVITADACLEYGFELPPFPAHFFEQLDTIYQSRVIAQQNPLDLGEIFDFPLFARIIEQALQLPEVDGVIFNHLYGARLEIDSSRRFLIEVKKLQQRYHKPIAVVIATALSEFSAAAQVIQYPLFLEPDDAVYALAKSRDFYAFKKRVPQITTQDKGSLILRQSKGQPFEKLDDNPNLIEAMDFVTALGVPTAPYRGCFSEIEAKTAAENLGFPVALKIVSPMASHKSDVGGVILNINGTEALEDALLTLKQRFQKQFPGARYQGFLIQKMMQQGHEFFIGAKRDKQFGPIIMLGLGGIYVETIRDTVMKLAPIDRSEALTMQSELRCEGILKGIRSQPPLDSGTLAFVTTLVSQILIDYPRIYEIDLNPILVCEQGLHALDVRITVA